MLDNIKVRSKCVGLWDLNQAPLSVGGLLILVCELLSMQEDDEPIDICFVGELPGVDNESTKIEISPEQIMSNPLLEVANSISGIGSLYHAPSLSVLSEALDENVTTWPKMDDRSYEYTCYLHLQELCSSERFKSLSLSIPLQFEAEEFFEKYVKEQIPVTIHLKNNPEQTGCSNANFDEWFKFFQYCKDRFPVKFILIGNEPIDARILNLPNVLATQKMNMCLAQELALVQRSVLFMGMATGPCNMALLSETPCVLFKNPDHHAEEMKRELGDRKRFTFCTELQSLLRKFEDMELLVNQFELLYPEALENHKKAIHNET